MTHTAPGHVTAAVLLANAHGELLIVQPAHCRDVWHLPGGIVEQGESPLEAARREVREELGIAVDLRERDLFAVEWLQATRADRRDRLAFIFAGPALGPFDTVRITLQRDEATAWRWATRDSARALVHPAVAARIAGPPELPGGAVYRERRHERMT